MIEGHVSPMRRFHLTTYFYLTIVFLVWWPTFLARAKEEKKLSALGIFDAALRKFEANRIALRKWQYRQTLTTQQLDGGGNIIARGTWHSIVRPGDPQPIEYTGKSVQGKLSFFGSGAEEPGAAATRSRSPKGKAATKTEEKDQVESAARAVRKYNLRDRYFWKRLPDGTAADEAAYVLAFAPKPKQNTRSREERFFGLLAGRVWISQRDFTLLKAEGALQSPCSLFWIIARVTTCSFTYELEPDRANNRLLRLSTATAKTVVAFPFSTVRQKHRQTVDKYESRTPRGSDASLR